ncbi:MAG TPA: hypothetical protein PKW33_08690 [Anaerolineaceae bacterium]|nr:hypothetical protein [Anaerolineaceae bacterium]HPN51651.1 hypothetical protein [Anaerolineaceae bacterium]
MSAKFTRHKKKGPSRRQKNLDAAFIDSRKKICPFCGQTGYAVYLREEWIGGWDGEKVYTYYCNNCHREAYESTHPTGNQLFFR